MPGGELSVELVCKDVALRDNSSPATQTTRLSARCLGAAWGAARWRSCGRCFCYLRGAHCQFGVGEKFGCARGVFGGSPTDEYEVFSGGAEVEIELAVHRDV